MMARTIAGWVALVSGALLVLGLVAGSVYGAGGGWVATTASGRTGMGPGMMPGAGMMPRGGAGMGGMMPGFGGMYAGQGPIAGAPEVRVEAQSFSFHPNEIRIPKDHAVNLTLVNTADLLHDLTVPSLGIQIVAPAGTTRTVGVPSIPAGRYVAYCSVPAHADAGMRATLIVE